MKKWILCFLLAAWTAVPALAFVQSGHLPKNQQQQNSPTSVDVRAQRQYDEIPALDPGVSSTYSVPTPALPVAGGPVNDDPAHPVPEPGTMALASMGLLALGAAARKRRSG